ncbi:MAG: general secretion pathway protein GspB [Desulfobacteraceae bacterium]|nr:general secretion pathway protein GspB [Desulfobacteraceae bacterium]
MSKREKIILALTLVVALYGVMDLFVFSSKKTDTSGPAPAADGVTSSAMANKLMAKILNMEIEQPLKKNIIAKIESPWQGDPFVRSEEQTEQQATQSDDAQPIFSGLVYSGYIFAGDRVMAIINGNEYRNGDIVLETGYRVVRITPDKVIVQKDQNTAEISFNGE